MKSEEILELANVCADKIDDGNRTPRQAAIIAYKEGFDNGMKNCHNVWHEISEYPNPEKSVIVVTKIRRRFKHYTFSGEKQWNNTMKSINAWKWAYKEDLL